MDIAIDVHNHIVPEGFPACPPTCALHWPHVEHHGAEEASVIIGGKLFRKIDHRCWHIDRRLSDMANARVRKQVLSPMPELLSYWIDPKDALFMARHVNSAIAEMISKAPDSFEGMGMVPLQDPQLAAKELASFRTQYGLVGVEIGSNINGKSPGDSFFDPFYAEAERQDIAIFVHALRPTGLDRLIGPPSIAAFVGFPTDVGLAAASFVSGRTLEKFPNLRIGFSHGGGTFAAILPRLTAGWTSFEELNSSFVSPQSIAKKFFYDDLLFDVNFTKYIIDVFGVQQVFIGSDYPFPAGEMRPVDYLEQIGLSPADFDLLAQGNARRFLKI